MLLTFLVLLVVDVISSLLLLSCDEGAYLWLELWLCFLSPVPGLVGGMQALGCAALGPNPPRGALRSGIRVLAESMACPQDPTPCWRALLRLVSGSALVFGGLSLFILSRGLFPTWLSAILYVQWNRLAPMGLAAIFWAPILAMPAGPSEDQTRRQGLMAAAGSLLGWRALWIMFGGWRPVFWQVALSLIVWVPAYGSALLWGGIFWRVTRSAGADTRSH